MFNLFRSKKKQMIGDNEVYARVYNELESGDNEVYARAYNELQSGDIHYASMARALVKAEGNQEKATGIYIQERIGSLKEEMLKQQSLEKNKKSLEKNKKKTITQDFRLLTSYYDPSYKSRSCNNCSAHIPKGRVYCFNCKTMQE
ncbi:hypothetical protein [Photobacterium andalusiense]|uniref:Uncharacterized protein n=1 Tax=Photobacterium andalusiense TaxID=2204296 RepID=A0A1Y6MQJ7_9GAMM|nr:hypothetical protein [Photobacterium andalusiense]SMY37501.1 hypothetical protein PAND9192_03152 [Photobacterium andalusiense]